jgi:hypothetical protein
MIELVAKPRRIYYHFDVVFRISVVKLVTTIKGKSKRGSE